MDDDTSPAAFWTREWHHRQKRDVEELRKIMQRHNIEEEKRNDQQQKHDKVSTATAHQPMAPVSYNNAAVHIVRAPHNPNGGAMAFAAAALWDTSRCAPPTQLTLPPIGTPFFARISVHVDAGHFFVQLPAHPSFSSLPYLDSYMLSVYTQPGGAPGLPKPCNVGVLCAAPAYTGWFRAITLAYDQDQDEMLVRFVDYGGFARLPRADLRQIRTDFMNLPLQGIECYLANVQPIDGSLHWSEKANELFQQLCVSKTIQAAPVGYCKSIPCVELFVDYAKKTVRFDQILLERGLAKPMDPSLIVRTPFQMG